MLLYNKSDNKLTFFLFLDYGDLDMMIESKIIKLGTSAFQCAECEFPSRLKSTVSNHIESKYIKHGGISCDLCGKVCATRQACRMHKSRDHNPKKLAY